MELLDKDGNPLKEGIYVNMNFENPNLRYASIVSMTNDGPSFSKDNYPPVICCLKPETHAAVSIPMTYELREAFCQTHGQGFLDWLERQKTRHPNLSTVLEDLAQSQPKLTGDPDMVESDDGDQERTYFP